MRRKLRGSVLIAALVLAFAAVLGGAVPASATADNCGTNGDSGTYNCMYVDGSLLLAYEIRGWSKYDGFGYPVHEEVTGPSGDDWPGGLVCNSATTTTANPDQVVGCQVYPDANVTPGTYCSILWEYKGGKYLDDAKNCVSVSAS